VFREKRKREGETKELLDSEKRRLDEEG